MRTAGLCLTGLLVLAGSGVVGSATPEDNLQELFKARLHDRYAFTESQIRMLGLAVQVWEQKHKASLPATEGSALIAVQELSALLVPGLLPEIPNTDGWGNPYWYWSDGTSYAFVSFGRGNQPDVDYAKALKSTADVRAAICKGAGKGYGTDLVYFGGAQCNYMGAVK